MFRSAMCDLIKWKTTTDRKPLIIRGARQVGKTWLMKEFEFTPYAINRISEKYICAQSTHGQP